MTVGAVVFLVAVVSLYIYKDLGKSATSGLTKQENNSAKSATSTAITDPNKDLKISVEKVQNSEQTASNLGKMPNLERPIENLSKLDGVSFQKTAQDIVELTKKLKLEPQNRNMWLDLAVFRKMLGDYSASLEILNYVAVLWPKDYISFNNLADLYQYYLKNYPLAEKNWLKVIELKPDYPPAYENLFTLYTVDHKEKQALALPVLLKGLTQNPDSTDLMVYIARYYNAMGNKEQASIYYNKAIDVAKLEKNEQLEASLRAEAAEVTP